MATMDPDSGSHESQLELADHGLVAQYQVVQTDGNLGNQKEEKVNIIDLQSYILSFYQKSTSYLVMEIPDAELERNVVPPRFKGKVCEGVVFEFSDYVPFSDSQQLKKAESLPTARQNASVRELAMILPISAYYCVSLWLFIWYPKPMVKKKLEEEEEALEDWPHDSLRTRHIKLASKHDCLVSNWFTMEVKQDLHKKQMSYANFSASLTLKTMLIFAFNGSNHPSLKWLSVRVWVTKPMGKMKLMIVLVSCKVLKEWGMTRSTHMQAQHGELIGSDMEKQFDLDVLSVLLRQQSILQCRDGKSNRTIVHLYVQFGQRSGRVFTNRSGVYGQLGIPQDRDRFICAFEGMIHEFVMDISARFSYIVVLTSKREVYTWGRYENRQLGLGHTRERNSVSLVETLKGREVGNITWESIRICCDWTNELQGVWYCVVLSISHTLKVLRVTEEPGELVRISLNTHGTRVVQKLTETLKTRQQISLVISALEPGFLGFIKDLNEYREYIVDIAMHQHVLRSAALHQSFHRRISAY